MLLVGCDLFGPQACTTEAVPGVEIDVVHAVTGEPVTSALSGALSEGSYQEEMLAHENRLIGALEREGRYSAAVTADGYRVWIMDGIEVEDDGCHVETVRLEAELAPL